MDKQSPFLAIIPDETERQFYNQVAISLGYPFSNIVIGSPDQATATLRSTNYSPAFIVIDIGNRTHDVLPELDALAQCCEVSTRVIVVGNTNDISLYRALIDKGVLEYFMKPVDASALRATLIKNNSEGSDSLGSVISFMGAAAGDGSSTIAINTAYSLATKQDKPTVIVDLDYQFGMTARNLDLASPYGIKEIFDHPDRGVDRTLVERMAVNYKNKLDIIAAPTSLHFMPPVHPESVRSLIQSLQEKYDYVILDIPHLWNNWISAAITSSNHLVISAQLWLKSVTHSSRILAELKALGLNPGMLSIAINRNGSRFKEAVNAKDFERVTGYPIDFYIPNDIKTVVKAENQGNVLMELGRSSLANEIEKLADKIAYKLHSQEDEPLFKASSSVRISHHDTKRLT